ncbi:hypothetical protein AMTRI_Chr02g264490 [Amborella trichopoda]|uniref:Peptidase A1 domain-containing protein n=1 Tax=Amborella trichopoda TaxID=13333 RepID=U5D629_AMBTC|nr:aspartic proteinase nepenthesin-1 [Amborella trichopoda]ERN16887.1 hypothetical protein AMTR_s00057p00162630 [Amborella trichopoda]|eukprot:XP_006855420.3 aspartic proteinase nepenthesin-1 [Amborella trichopoda]
MTGKLCFMILLFTIISLSSSLSLPLIHHLSLSSQNRTTAARLRRLVQISSHRLHYLSNFPVKNSSRKPQSHVPQEMAPEIHGDSYLYLVNFSLGTPPVQQLAILDTSSPILWIQCEPCDPCFSQSVPIFSPESSKSFSPVHCSDPLCNGLLCDNNTNLCTFSSSYGQSATTSGQIATETLTFSSDSGDQPEFSPKIAIGCGFSNRNFKFPGGFSGIFGLSNSPISFISQYYKSEYHQFSYCLLRLLLETTETQTSQLRFGIEAKLSGPDVRSFELLDYANSLYYLNLTDISIGDNRLGIPPKVFDMDSDKKGGFVIDSGATVSYLRETGYSYLKDGMVYWFSGAWNLTQIDGKKYSFDLCWEIPTPEFNEFPNLTLHFGEKDWELMPENVFYVDRNARIFCMVILASDKMSILGTYQQQDFRVLYDISGRRVSVQRASCAGGG